MTAVRGFLTALAVPAQNVPADPDEPVALYRSQLAGRRMLVVLDNARDAEQVRPLLPGAPGCLVLVTSRDQLAGLVAREGAVPLTVRALTHGEARELLIRRLGPDRVAREHAVVDELIDRCVRLPLALNIAAAHAALRPNRPLAAFVDELHDPDTTRDAMDELARAHLINEYSPGRYITHDLLRAYAAEQVRIHDGDAERQAALRRVVDFYTHTACRAEHLLTPHRAPIPLDLPVPGVHPHRLADAPAALAWFDAEHAVLLAAQQAAVACGWHASVWQLACSLITFHIRRGRRHDQVAVWQAALDAAAHLPDPSTRMFAHRRLGSAVAELGRHDEGIAHLRQAVALAEEHHDLDQQAETHRILAWAWEQQGDNRQAVEHATRTLDLARALGQPVREAEALNQLGWYLAQLGEFDPARIRCLAVLASLGDFFHTADALDTLGHPHAALGERDQARTVWRQARELYRQQGREQAADRVQRQLDTLDRGAD